MCRYRTVSTTIMMKSEGQCEHVKAELLTGKISTQQL